MINTKTNKFLADLTELVNHCGLPPVNARLCLELTAARLIDAENQVMAKEQAAEKAAKVKENAEKPAPGKPEQG